MTTEEVSEDDEEDNEEEAPPNLLDNKLADLMADKNMSNLAKPATRPGDAVVMWPVQIMRWT